MAKKENNKKINRELKVAFIQIATALIVTVIGYISESTGINGIPQNENSKSSINVSSDTSYQINLNQQNSGGANVTNEFVAGDKTVNINNFSEKESSYKADKKKNVRNSDTVIVNNGFINQGGSGNVYNQTITTKPAERVFTDSDLQLIESQIPKDYSIMIIYVSSCKECLSFSNSISSILIENGYSVTRGRAGVLITEEYDHKFGIRVEHEDKSGYIYIKPQD